MQSEYGLEGGVSVADLVRFPGALERVEEPWPTRRRRSATRLSALARRRARRARRDAAGGGRAPRAELERLLDAIEGAAARIEARSAESRRARQAALRERLQASSRELGLEDARLYQEVVRAVERHDVAEEVQRLRSHVASARELLAADGAPAASASTSSRRS